VAKRIAELPAKAAQRAQKSRQSDSFPTPRKSARLLSPRDSTLLLFPPLKEIGVLSGLRIERREQGAPNEFERMSDAELEAESSRIRTRLRCAGKPNGIGEMPSNGALTVGDLIGRG
jgi:hypothetical protein